MICRFALYSELFVYRTRYENGIKKKEIEEKEERRDNR